MANANNDYTFGVHIDCSRNAVMNLETAKNLVDILSKMGYNEFILYTEDTYELTDEPLFGYMRGRYSKSELKELNQYCLSRGMTFSLSIQTLAHLNCMFKWEEYEDIRDCLDIMLAGEEKTYALIEKMFMTLKECTSSKSVFIGMDEAYFLGYGKYKEKHGEPNRFELISTHLKKVAEIGAKYGFQVVVCFDMVAKLATGSSDLFNIENEEAIKDIDLPENIVLDYWNYYGRDYDKYMQQIGICEKFGLPILFAGGVWNWEGFFPETEYAMGNIEVAMRACRDKGIKHIVMTCWGDDGNECSRYTYLPSLMYAVETAKGNTDLDSIKRKYKEITGMDFDAFLSLDKMDHPGEKHEGYSNPSKYLIYNDVFTGLNDYRCSADDAAYYAKLRDEFKEVKLPEMFSHTIDTAVALADLHSVKADIGVRVRKAYKENNTDELKKIADDYLTVIEKFKNFHDVFEKQWFLENKPFGFDVHDMRLGGQIQRIISCRRRLLDYTDGKIDRIEELEVELVEAYPGNNWHSYSTPNVVSHMLYRL